jgi:hypothetical protein
MGSWVTEKIVEWDPPNRYAYELTGGAPLSNHHGEVHVIPEGEGSRIRWAVRFCPRIPLTGRLIAAALEHLLRQALSSAPLGWWARRWWSGGSSLRQIGQVPCQQARSACSSRTIPKRVRLPPWLAGAGFAPG